MKIVIPIFGYINKTGGYRVLAQLASHWTMQGHEVVFLSYYRSKEPYFPSLGLMKYYDDQGNIVDHQYSEELLNVGLFRMIKIIKNALEKIDGTDIILANYCMTAFSVKFAKTNAKKFYYVQAYEPDFFTRDTIKDIIRKNISRLSYKLGLDIIVNSPMYLNYKEIKSQKFIYPGIDFNIFRPHNKIKGNKIILGTVGRTSVIKGTNYIIEAFHNLRREYGEGIELHIAFGTAEMSGDGIKVVDCHGDSNLADFYNSLSVYICAGTFQLKAVHYPVIESMACKIPLITTGYYPARDDNSLIIPIKSSEAIENAVIRFIQSDEKQILLRAEKAFRDIQEFEWSKKAGEFIEIFMQKCQSRI